MTEPMTLLAADTSSVTKPEALTRRDFLYIAAGAFAAVGTAVVLWPFIASMNPSADVQALSTTAVGAMHNRYLAGQTSVHRPSQPTEIARAEADDTSPSLFDPHRDEDRVQRKDWLIVVATRMRAIGEKADRTERTVGRLVLPLPSLAIRHIWPGSPGAGTQKPGGATLLLRFRYADCHRGVATNVNPGIGPHLEGILHARLLAPQGSSHLGRLPPRLAAQHPKPS
jgi:hypothetical protein